MKALTILQPWASAIAEGVKRIETRSWQTKYRGPLAIHAGLGQPASAVFNEACQAAGLRSNSGASCSLPLGQIIAVCELVDCRYTTDWREGRTIVRGEFEWELTEREYALGGYGHGRFAWLLANVRKLPVPVHCSGQRGLWDVPAGLLAELQEK